MRNVNDSLTAKQLRWIDEYLIDFNGTAAAVRAGYSVKCARSIAYENLTKPDIQAILQARQAVTAEDLKITRQGVIRSLLDAIEMGREQQNPGAMVSGLREICRMLGFYGPKVKRVELTTGQDVDRFDFSAMNDVQLLALISQGAVAI